MKKLLFSLFYVGFLFIISSCTGNSQPDGTGYIFEISEKRILILDHNFENTQWEDLSKEYKGHAIWLTFHNNDLKKGQKVAYWIDGGIDDSYPAQAKAKKVEVLND